MKKLLIAFLVLLAGAAVFGLYTRLNPDAPAPAPQLTIESVREHLSGTSINIPELSDGVSVTVVAEETPQGITTYSGSYQDPADDQVRAFVSLAVDNPEVIVNAGEDQDQLWVFIPYYANFGGTGTFLNIGLFSFDGESLTHHDSLFIDDRVSLLAVQQEGDGYSVAYLTRAPGEGMAAQPTIPAIVRFTRTGSEIDMIMMYHNAARDDIELDIPAANQTVGSTFTIDGQARGYWYFEASFTAEVWNDSAEMIEEAIVQADGEWMTEDFVPFEEEITVENYEGPATLLLRRSNASGEPEREAWISIPITISQD